MEKIIDILCLYTEQILGVIGILFILAFEAYLFSMNKEAREKKHKFTKKTTGTVISAERTFWALADEDPRYRHHRYSFCLQYKVGGQTYTLNGNASYAYVGEKYKVYYNPENPQESDLGGFQLIIWVSYFTIAFLCSRS